MSLLVKYNVNVEIIIYLNLIVLVDQDNLTISQLICLHSNHVTSIASEWTLSWICYTTMCRNSINFLDNPGHVTLWWLEVVLVVYARVQYVSCSHTSGSQIAGKMLVSSESLIIICISPYLIIYLRTNVLYERGISSIWDISLIVFLNISVASPTPLRGLPTITIVWGGGGGGK